MAAGVFRAASAALARAYRVALVGGDTTRGPLVRDRAAARSRAARTRRCSAVARAPGMRCSSPARPGMRPRVSPSSSAASRPRRGARLSARALPAAEPARGPRRAAARLRQRLHRCVRWFVRRCRQARAGERRRRWSCSSRRCRSRKRCARRSAMRARARLALSGGDDYELCFAVPAANVTQLHRAAAAAGVGLHAHRLTARGRRRARAARRYCDGVLAFRLSAFQLNAAELPRRALRAAHAAGTREGCITVGRRCETVS